MIVYTMTAAGADQTNRSINQANDVDPAWSPDGKQIVVVTGRDGNAEIYRMRTDGSSQVNRTNNAASDTDPDWQPRRRR